MVCPDREQLSRHLDGQEPGVGSHLHDCATCQTELAALIGVDEVLRREAKTRCPAPEALVRSLSSGVAPGGCEPCSVELVAMRGVLARHDKNELERPSADLRARLKRLAPAHADTAHDREQSARLRTSSRRTKSSGSGSGSGTGRHARPRKATAPVSVRTVSRGGQPWIWGSFAAAAAVMFGIALAIGARREPLPTQQARLPERVRPVESAPVAPQGPPKIRGAAERPAAETPRPRQLPREEVVDPSPEPPDRQLEPSTPVEPAGEPERPAPSPGRTSVADPVAEAGPVSPPPRPIETPAAASIVDDGGRLALAIDRVHGPLQVAHGGKEWSSLPRSGTLELAPGDRLRAGPRGAFLSLEGGTYEVCLAEESELEVRAAAAGPVLRLAGGRLLAEVATLPPGRCFQVETAQGRFEVLGTTFGVDAKPDATGLIVLEGTVAASSQAGSVEVGPGFGTSLGAGAPRAEPADPRGLSWAKDLLPQRELIYATDFDQRVLGGFDGELTADGAMGGKGLALQLARITDNKYWGQRARAIEGRIKSIRAAKDVWVAVSVWSEEPTDFLVLTTNATQKKDFKAGFSLAARRWKTIHVPLLELTTYFDPAKNPMREGDLLVSIELFAAKPGAKHRVLVDGVAVYRKHYR